MADNESVQVNSQKKKKLLILVIFNQNGSSGMESFSWFGQKKKLSHAPLQMKEGFW